MENKEEKYLSEYQTVEIIKTKYNFWLKLCGIICLTALLLCWTFRQDLRLSVYGAIPNETDWERIIIGVFTSISGILIALISFWQEIQKLWKSNKKD